MNSNPCHVNQGCRPIRGKEGSTFLKELVSTNENLTEKKVFSPTLQGLISFAQTLVNNKDNLIYPVPH